MYLLAFLQCFIYHVCIIYSKDKLSTQNIWFVENVVFMKEPVPLCRSPVQYTSPSPHDGRPLPRTAGVRQFPPRGTSLPAAARCLPPSGKITHYIFLRQFPPRGTSPPGAARCLPPSGKITHYISVSINFFASWYQPSGRSKMTAT